MQILIFCAAGMMSALGQKHTLHLHSIPHLILTTGWPILARRLTDEFLAIRNAA
jgi:hypothetical protein